MSRQRYAAKQIIGMLREVEVLIDIAEDLDGDWPSPYSIADRWRNAVENRKLPPVRFHGLRHSHASALIAAGLDVLSISPRLGRASPALTLSAYSRVFGNDDEAAAAIEKAISG